MNAHSAVARPWQWLAPHDLHVASVQRVLTPPNLLDPRAFCRSIQTVARAALTMDDQPGRTGTGTSQAPILLEGSDIERAIELLAQQPALGSARPKKPRIHLNDLKQWMAEHNLSRENLAAYCVAEGA